MIQWRVHVQPPRQGTSHIKYGTPCQDAAWTETTDAAITAALCDGIGSLADSRIAAKTAAKTAAQLVSRRVSEIVSRSGTLILQEDELEQLRREILSACREAIALEAARLGLSDPQMDCTLLLACLTRDGGRVLFGQLGDGAICAMRRDRGVLLRAPENPNRVMSNQTATVLSSDAADWFRLRLYLFEEGGAPLDGFLLTTDGLQNEIYSNVGRVKKQAEWYATLVSGSEPEECAAAIGERWDLLAADESHGFTDDMSLVAVMRPGVVFELPEDVNWLCVCGHRNHLESSRCESCGKDFLRVYKGVNFRAMQISKRAYFARLNADPQEEVRVLQGHSVYPLEFALPGRKTGREDAREQLPPAAARTQEQTGAAYAARHSADSAQQNRQAGAGEASRSAPPAARTQEQTGAAYAARRPADSAQQNRQAGAGEASRSAPPAAARAQEQTGTTYAANRAASSAQQSRQADPVPLSWNRAEPPGRRPPCSWCAARHDGEKGARERPCGRAAQPETSVKPCGRTADPAFCARFCGKQAAPRAGSEPPLRYRNHPTFPPRRSPEEDGRDGEENLLRAIRQFLGRFFLLALNAGCLALLLRALRLL